MDGRETFSMGSGLTEHSFMRHGIQRMGASIGSRRSDRTAGMVPKEVRSAPTGIPYVSGWYTPSTLPGNVTATNSSRDKAQPVILPRDHWGFCWTMLASVA